MAFLIEVLSTNISLFDDTIQKHPFLMIMIRFPNWAEFRAKVNGPAQAGPLKFGTYHPVYYQILSGVIGGISFSVRLDPIER